MMRTPDGKEEKDLLELEGVVERVIYKNDANGYAICELSLSDEEYITIVGTMPYVSVGESVKALGEWTVHPNFGRQFKVSYFEKQLPATTSTILKYLSSRTVKGIGPKTAKLIVEAFGEDTFDVLENHPEWLSQIQGISEKKAVEISANFKEQFGIRSVMMFCQNYFGPTTAVRVYNRWGGSAVDVIKENPYLLCEEIYGISFEKADNIARELGTKKNARFRVMAGIRYLCTYNAFQNGHVFLPEDKLIPGVVQMLGIETYDAEDALEQMLTDGKAVCVKHGGRRCIYLKEYFEAETYVCRKMDLLDKTCERSAAADIYRWIMKIESEEQIEYAKLQRRAIEMALDSGVMILTGGPGTGKTTVIKAVMRIFDDMGLKIALAAPTGRAAKRMSEATQVEAKTIHRLLEMEYADDIEPRFRRDANNLLDEDIIIIDEASMIDIMLMQALLKAIHPGARLILIGDADQLPPVGAGYVLNDLIASDRFSTVQLTEIFRQAQESLIITNAHAINHGEMPDLKTKTRDFFFMPRADEVQTAETVAQLCAVRLPRSYGEQIRDEIQVITPSRKGEAGTELLNVRLQAILNPPAPDKKEKKMRDIVFREGDKVMQIKNNYDIPWEREVMGRTQDGIGIFNGDIGIIERINLMEETMRINFDDRHVTYDFTMLDELEHAYAVTVHKSQGSEYPVVILPVYKYTMKLLTRNLLYTAVTRASRMVIMVGDEETVYKMIANNRQTKRYTGLPYFLKDYSENSWNADGHEN
ncbi:MAG: ATP-dependent RecD-like DNA helicase [Clostridia bacterium]|nr:ATP-dependent RecD-like DNA helicase [Clostridia bacterium]